MALQGSVVDVPLSTLDQNSPASTKPIGVLSALTNCMASKFTSPRLQTPGGAPQSVRVQPRPGYVGLNRAKRTPATAVPTGTNWSDPTALIAFGNELVGVNGGRPAVYTAESPGWVEPQNYVHPTQILRQRELAVSSATMQTPSAAYIGGVSAAAWYESGTGVRVGFRDDAGTWMRTPFTLNTDTRVKVTADATTFWVVSDDGAHFHISAFDTNGVILATYSALVSLATFWDLQYCPGEGVLLAQPPGTGMGLQLSTLAYSAGVITVTSNSDLTIDATGLAVSFLANDAADNRAYIATYGSAAPGAYNIQVYRIHTRAQNYVSGVVTGFGILGEITGHVSAATVATVAYTVLDQSVTYDPLFNDTLTALFPAASAAPSTLKTTSSVTLASRAFALNGKRYAVAYYFSATQPCWFLLPLDAGTQPHAGRWEYGVAYADWINNLTSPRSQLFSLSNAASLTSGVEIALSYRAESFSAATRTGGDVPVLSTVSVNAVGVKMFTIGAGGATAIPAVTGDECLIGGAMATGYTGGVFVESGVALAPEAPTHAIAAGSLTGNYQWVVVWEWTDGNGNRRRSRPSTAVNNTGGEAGGVHSYVFTGKALHMTAVSDMTVSLYRTINVGGVQSVAHYKVTSDTSPVLNSTTAASWTFTDNVSDAAAAVGEKLYVDQGFMERYPPPPFSVSATWLGRQWCVSYDNSLWFSGPKEEGDAAWYHPALRVTMPTTDLVTNVAAMDDYLLVFCANSVWYLPRTSLPDATGNGGTIPEPVQLPFVQGCTGAMAVVRDGVVYASSGGGVWMITRALENRWLGEAAADDLAGAITSITVDAAQRIHVLCGSNIVVYDTVAGAWATWTPPQVPSYMTTWRGQNTIASTNVFTLAPSQVGWDSLYDGTNLPFVPSFTVNPVHIGGVRSYKRCWDIQLLGQYRGPHTLTVALSYDESGTASTTYAREVTSGATPYQFSFPPTIELASAIGVTVTVSAAAGQPLHDSASFELLAFYVGLEKGANRLPLASRVRAT